MNKKIIKTTTAPQAIGPYSQAVISGSLLFVSGQIPLDPSNGNIVEGDIKQHARQIFINIGQILTSTNLTYQNIVKTTVFLTDLSQFSQINEVFEEFLSDPFPARSTVQVSALPKNAQIEIEVIADTNIS